jgi:hypothetical protein
MTAPRGLLTYLFGTLASRVTWENPATGPNPTSGRRRRVYGTRQKSSARAGEAMKLLLDNGEMYTVRVTGPHMDFIGYILSRTQPGKVANVFSARGTEYGPQLTDVTPL